jgi:hypothetical protein
MTTNHLPGFCVFRTGTNVGSNGTPRAADHPCIPTGHFDGDGNRDTE